MTCKSKTTESEFMALLELRKLGFKNEQITYQRVKSPDFITINSLGVKEYWEVKEIGRSMIVNFTPYQLTLIENLDAKLILTDKKNNKIVKIATVAELRAEGYKLNSGVDTSNWEERTEYALLEKKLRFTAPFPC